MTEFVKGQRVRVSYEAEYRGSAGDGFVQVSINGRGPIAPIESIEAIAPPRPQEPTALGSVVEVNGVRYGRLDESSAPFLGADGDWSWDDLLRRGPVKVLFDPDKPNLWETVQGATREEVSAFKAQPEPPKTVVDGTGDTWYLKSNGRYRLDLESHVAGVYTLEEIRAEWGVKE